MKKLALCVCLLFALGGCSDTSGDLERGLRLRDKLLSGNGCCFSAIVTADYGDQIYSFTMDCQGDSLGNLSFTVTAPDTIAGISGGIFDTGGELTFEDTALAFGLMADDTLSPVAAPWIFLKTLRSGYLTSAGIDNELLRLSIDDSYDDDALQLDIWLNAEDVPVCADVVYDGRRILSISIRDFRIL